MNKLIVIDKPENPLRANWGMRHALHKAKAFGIFKWPAFLFFSIAPLIKLLSGRGDDYLENFRKHDCVLELVGTDVKKGTVFYLPDFEQDLIQGTILTTDSFFERFELAHLRKNYIRKGDVCLDIGANIGNHSVYFAKNCHASKVYAFEPVKSTFDVLKRNIELNNLEKCIQAYNYGISDRMKSASIVHFDETNIGATQLTADATGNLKLIALDDMSFQMKVDFVKIDVEGMEYDVLFGGSKFLHRTNQLFSSK